MALELNAASRLVAAKNEEDEEDEEHDIKVMYANEVAQMKKFGFKVADVTDRRAAMFTQTEYAFDRAMQKKGWKGEVIICHRWYQHSYMLGSLTRPDGAVANIDFENEDEKKLFARFTKGLTKFSKYTQKAAVARLVATMPAPVTAGEKDYEVAYTDQSGKMKRKNFKTDAQREKWIDQQGDNIDVDSYRDPTVDF